MKYQLHKSFLTCGFFLTALGLIALGEGRRVSPKGDQTPNTLVIATTTEPVTLHPVFGSYRMAQVEILGALFEPLTVFDDHQQLVPCLAVELPTLANGGLRQLPDAEATARGGRMESVWHLRPDARWSDGVPVRAEDFIFTYELIKNDDVPVPEREVENRIARMEARDDGRTLVVLWKEPYAFAAEGHRHRVVPRHIEEPRFQALADKKEYERTPFNQRPVGNGPYRVAEWAFSQYLVLEPQPFWHGPRPALERLVYRFIPEPETILANLETGRLGAVSPTALEVDLALDYARRAQARGGDSYVVETRPGLLWEHIDFNLENPITADRRVRQALTLGLNRRALCELLFPGRDYTTDTWLPPLHPACFPQSGVTPDLPRYPSDPARAVRLLEDAGWHPGPGGVRVRDGQALRLTLTYVAGETLTDRVAQVVKEDWRALGVELDLRPVDATQFTADSPENLAYKGLALYPWLLDPSADGITFWTAENIPTPERSTGQNMCRWRSPRSDELLVQATQTLDPSRQRELLWEQQRIWAEDLPAMPLFFEPEVSIRHRDLAGWRPTGTDTPVTWNCYEWSWAGR